VCVERCQNGLYFVLTVFCLDAPFFKTKKPDRVERRHRLRAQLLLAVAAPLCTAICDSLLLPFSVFLPICELVVIP